MSTEFCPKIAVITIKKLQTLPPPSRLRKVSLIFRQAAFAPPADAFSAAYLNEVGQAALSTASALFEPSETRRLSALLAKPFTQTVLMDLSFELLRLLGAEPADWDFVQRGEDGVLRLDPSRREVFPLTLVLDRVRSPFNVGSIFRTAESFGVERILLVEGSASPLHPRARRTSRGTDTVVPWKFVGEEEVCGLLREASAEVVALELGGGPLCRCGLPREGFALIGSEELGVSPELLSLATSRVSIPMGGSKGSLNVSVAAGIFLYEWRMGMASGRR